MTRAETSDRRGRGGVAYVMSLMVMVLFSVLGVALASSTMMNLRAGDNHQQATNARLAAESGMDFILSQLRSVRLSPTTSEETLPANLAQALGEILDGTANLNGQSVTVSGTAVCVPDIQLPFGSFSCTLASAGPDKCTLVVQGSANTISRSVAIDLILILKPSAVFNYGLVSFGPVVMSGQAKILGVNDPSEAGVLAAPTSEGIAASLGGNAVIAGDLTVMSEGTIAITGNPSLGGVTDPDEMLQHIHLLTTAPDVPALDTAPLAALATNVVDSSTDTSSSGLTFNNIRIAAGTNPTFGNNVVINGIVYVEMPNIVIFSGSATFNGMIVTEDGDQPIESCQISFSTEIAVNSVDTLPETPEFEQVRQHTGTFILAPGFAATFSGQFSAISGTVAADQLTFSGQSDGTVEGAVIGLGEYPTTLDGNVEICVDRLSAYPDPAGFGKALALEADPASYTELTGG